MDNELKEPKGYDPEVVLSNARRLWYWDGAATLSQLSVENVDKGGIVLLLSNKQKRGVEKVCGDSRPYHNRWLNRNNNKDRKIIKGLILEARKSVYAKTRKWIFPSCKLKLKGRKIIKGNKL